MMTDKEWPATRSKVVGATTFSVKLRCQESGPLVSQSAMRTTRLCMQQRDFVTRWRSLKERSARATRSNRTLTWPVHWLMKPMMRLGRRNVASANRFAHAQGKVLQVSFEAVQPNEDDFWGMRTLIRQVTMLHYLSRPR